MPIAVIGGTGIAITRIIMGGLKIIVILGAVLVPGQAGATFSSFLDWEGSKRIWCETRLVPALAGVTEKVIKRRLENRGPFQVDARDRVTDLTLKKLNIDRDVYRAQTEPLFLSFAIKGSDEIYPIDTRLTMNGHLITNIGFPDSRPTIWFAVKEDTRVGFITDADNDGARIFLSLGAQGQASLGIDVPCEDLDKYLAGPAFTWHVIHRRGELCRVEVLEPISKIPDL